MKRIFLSLILMLAVCGVLMAQSHDGLILKRTPVIDGVIGDFEWDVFYETTDGGNHVTAYANWDNSYFYAAVKASKPSNVALEIDCAGNGWHIGNDNYMFKFIEGKSPEAYRASGSEDSPAVLSPLNPTEQSSILCRSGNVHGEYVIEIAIPVSAVMKEFSLKPDAVFGFNIAVQPVQPSLGEWTMFNPGDMANNCIPAKLVTYKSSVLGDVTFDFVLEREIITAGEALDGWVKISNKGSEDVNVSSMVLAGEGDCEKYVDAYKIIVGDIKSKKSFQREYHTATSPDIENGTWVLGAEIYSGDMKVGAAMKSFEIVSTVLADPITPKSPVYSDAKEMKVGVKVINYSKSSASGDVTIIPPAGWTPKGGRTVLPFKIYGYKKVALVEFKVIPPMGAFGEADFKFSVRTPKGAQEIPVSFTVLPASNGKK